MLKASDSGTEDITKPTCSPSNVTTDNSNFQYAASLAGNPFNKGLTISHSHPHRINCYLFFLHSTTSDEIGADEHSSMKGSFAYSYFAMAKKKGMCGPVQEHTSSKNKLVLKKKHDPCEKLDTTPYYCTV